MFFLTGARELLAPPGKSCLLGTSVQKAGATVKYDKDTYCLCMNSTSICARDTCPPLNCPRDRQHYPTSDSRCPQCQSFYENRTMCFVGDKVFRVRTFFLQSKSPFKFHYFIQFDCLK